MKQFTQEELRIWTQGGNIENDVPIYFVVIKGPHCPKCTALMNKKEIFGKLIDNFAEYTFKPGDTIAAGIFTNLQVASVPIILFRYHDKRDWKLFVILPNDIDDLECMFDALNANDQVYFGYNEWDEQIEPDAQEGFNRLLRLIYGECDPERLAERRKFKKEIGN